MRTGLLSFFVLGLAFANGHAQEAEVAEVAAPPNTGRVMGGSSKPTSPEFVGYYRSLFVGPVASVAGATRGGVFVGGSVGGIIAHRSLRAFTFPGFDLELGVIRAVQPGTKTDGFLSFNLQPTWTNKAHDVAPYVTAGYSRIFLSGNALNFGAGVNVLPARMARSGSFLRLEARDYWTFAAERQHLVTLRVAICFDVPDI